MKLNNNTSQKGFAPLLLVALLAVGIITGTVLVQNGVSFLPKAAEQEGLNPSAGKTKNCTDEADKAKCQADNDVICAKDTVTYCDNREGSPRAIRKSGGYYDPSHANTDPASGCVFDYREVSGKSSECGKSESKSGDVVYTTVDEAKKLDTDRKNTVSERAGQSGSSSGTTDAACTEPGVEDAMKDEKVTGNLVRLEAILAGMPEYCTPADLGVEPALSGTSTSGQSGRLMLCSGKDGALTWRVLTGTKLEPSTKEAPGNADNVRSELSANIKKATEKATPSKPAQPATGTNRSNCPGGVCP